jgi:hypothetical protein
MFKIRASAANQIMTNNRAKTGMGETAKGYCKDWVLSQIYGRSKEFSSKYTKKGTLQENQSIELTSAFIGQMLIKNADWFENDYFTGTPDIITANDVIDVKTSWDCFTFPYFETTAPEQYNDQLQVYMDLTGKRSAKLVYCLVDTPEFIVEREARSKAYDMGMDEVDLDLYDEVLKRHTFSNLPIELRIKSFDIEYNPERIEQIKNRVIECRNYIDTVLNTTPQILTIHDKDVTVFDNLPG